MKKYFVVLLALVLGMGTLTGCGKKEAKASESLYSYKTEYVGDNSKVVSIASHIKYPEGLKYDSVKILSDKEPYGIIVYLTEDKDVQNPDLFTQAVMTFALIDNLSNINYEIKETDDLIEGFNRDDVNLMLRENGKDEINTIGANEDNFNNFINSEKDA